MGTLSGSIVKADSFWVIVNGQATQYFCSNYNFIVHVLDSQYVPMPFPQEDRTQLNWRSRLGDSLTGDGFSVARYSYVPQRTERQLLSS